ncbi:hypothetical protein SAMN04488056_110120 [Cohaesibacter marisflavi]|uniref:Uncharacterized protein n=1 Tax=Cohaesibacter marisflavi TaxID=655353 RepID=A0A1I5J0W4_9HYPH|nr:hypothetical protein [Cohaesibacter marisflavi]SFO66299.1 hypothetical protein SAMN04488056_110120 [Cohaesibacter marisflavi]
MDLSVQKMQPPATTLGKTAAKKTSNNLSDDSVEDVPRDQAIDFKHGNTGYEAVDPDKEKSRPKDKPKRQGRRKNRQMLSGDDLLELTNTLETEQEEDTSAEEFLQVRAYQAKTQPKNEEDDLPHFEINI